MLRLLPRSPHRIRKILPPAYNPPRPSPLSAPCPRAQITNAKKNGITLGLFLFGTDRVGEFLEKGFNFISIGNDLHHVHTVCGGPNSPPTHRHNHSHTATSRRRRAATTTATATTALPNVPWRPPHQTITKLCQLSPPPTCSHVQARRSRGPARNAHRRPAPRTCSKRRAT